MRRIGRYRRLSVGMRVLAALVAFSVGFLNPEVAYAAKSLSEVNAEKSQAENEKNKTQKELNSIEGDIDELNESSEELEEEIIQIDEQLVDLMLSIDVLNSDIEAKNIVIDDAQKVYDEAKQKEEEKLDAMKRRIKFMYEKGNQSYVNVILQSANMSDLINKSDYAEKLYDYDREMLVEYQQTKEDMLEKKATLENELSELEEMQDDYLEEQEELESLVASKKAQQENYEAQISAAEEKAKEYKDRISKQNELIKAYEKEAKQIKTAEAKKKAEEALKKKLKEEEERRRAEEAKKAAEEAARKALEEEQNEDGDDADSGEHHELNVSDDDTDSESEEESTPEPTPTPEPQVSSDPGDSSKGQEIANYACQFVGNPYVPGGTSLTSGCDCSGFTSSVYAHFGISIPRSSYSQSAAGRAVSVSEMQPGDVIYYGGHVAIYIGNGSIVHASTQATGIKYSNAYYRSIITVRRFV